MSGGLRPSSAELGFWGSGWPVFFPVAPLHNRAGTDEDPCKLPVYVRTHNPGCQSIHVGRTTSKLSLTRAPPPFFLSQCLPTAMANPQPEELFSASLIPAAAASAVPDEGYRFRPLRRDDFGQGFLDCLRVLTWVGDYAEADFLERYDDMARSNGTYFYLVLEYGGRIVGTGALVVEKKLYVPPCPPPHAPASVTPGGPVRPPCCPPLPTDARG